MPFEIEFNFRKNEDALWLLALAVLIIASLLGMAQIGQNATPMNAGTPRLLGWSDWQLLQAQRAYTKELSILRADALLLGVRLVDGSGDGGQRSGLFWGHGFRSCRVTMTLVPST